MQDVHPRVLIAWCLVTTSQHLGSGQGSQGLPTASRLDVWARICCGDSWVAPWAVGELGFLLGLFWKRLFPVVVTAAPASVLGVRVRMSGGPHCVRGAGLGAWTQALGRGAPVVLCHPHQHCHIGRQHDRRDTQREGRCFLCGREGQGSLQRVRGSSASAGFAFGPRAESVLPVAVLRGGVRGRGDRLFGVCPGSVERPS